MGNCFNDLNRLDDALNEYNKCIEIDNTEADFYFKRAIIYGKKQNFNTCINEINICLQLNPNYYEAYYWRGRCFEASGAGISDHPQPLPVRRSCRATQRVLVSRR